MKAAAEEGGNPVSEMLTPEQMQNIGGPAALPAAIEPGKTWTEKGTENDPTIGNRNVETEFRYEGQVQEHDRPLERITQKLTVKAAGGPNPLPVELKKREGKGRSCSTTPRATWCPTISRLTRLRR